MAYNLVIRHTIRVTFFFIQKGVSTYHSFTQLRIGLQKPNTDTRL